MMTRTPHPATSKAVVVVLGSAGTDGLEFRVGTMTPEGFEKGLLAPDGQSFDLEVVGPHFGASEVYHDAEEAAGAAGELARGLVRDCPRMVHRVFQTLTFPEQDAPRHEVRHRRTDRSAHVGAGVPPPA